MYFASVFYSLAIKLDLFYMGIYDISAESTGTFCSAGMLSIAVSVHLMIYNILYMSTVDFPQSVERSSSISAGVGLTYYLWTGSDGTIVWPC